MFGASIFDHPLVTRIPSLRRRRHALVDVKAVKPRGQVGSSLSRSDLRSWQMEQIDP
jgi:hypothetical protein